jgi:hypothetical protein
MTPYTFLNMAAKAQTPIVLASVRGNRDSIPATIT